MPVRTVYAEITLYFAHIVCSYKHTHLCAQPKWPPSSHPVEQPIDENERLKMNGTTCSNEWDARLTAAAKILDIQPFGTDPKQPLTLEAYLADNRIGITKNLGVAALNDDDVFKIGDFF